MTAPTRDHILEAAARVYAELGFRGATTRRIAEAAGVNEVTLFRQFGSKEQLLKAAIQAHAQIHNAALPDEPADPERELTVWAAAEHRGLSECRSMIRKSMGEWEERPEAPQCLGEGPAGSHKQLRDYLSKLEQRGDIAQGGDLIAASAMLMGSLFADAMGREMMPSMFPQPAASAPSAYVRLTLAALGFDAARSRRATPRSRRAS
jgi:AcrR family transcriptional regulator